MNNNIQYTCPRCGHIGAHPEDMSSPICLKCKEVMKSSKGAIVKKSEYVDDELVVLTEEQFLQYGELDPEYEHIIHHDHRVFDYITKEIGLISEAEEFCNKHNHITTLDQITYEGILENLIKEMKKRKNPNC